MRAGREQLVERTLEQFDRTFHTFARATAAEWLDLDLSISQLKALAVLIHEQPVTVGALADRLGLGMSGGSHLVDRLVQERLVERSEDPDNRRRTLLRLTPDAEALVRRLRQGRAEQLRRYLRRMAEEDLAALQRGLCALVAAHREDEDDLAAS